MTTVYILNMSAYNGSVTMFTRSDAFLSKELAEETKVAVERDNKTSIFPIVCNIEERSLYESRDEIPILNGQ